LALAVKNMGMAGAALSFALAMNTDDGRPDLKTVSGIRGGMQDKILSKQGENRLTGS
jgi:hypothetical protein